MQEGKNASNGSAYFANFPNILVRILRHAEAKVTQTLTSLRQNGAEFCFGLLLEFFERHRSLHGVRFGDKPGLDGEFVGG